MLREYFKFLVLLVRNSLIAALGSWLIIKTTYYCVSQVFGLIAAKAIFEGNFRVVLLVICFAWYFGWVGYAIFQYPTRLENLQERKLNRIRPRVT